MAGQPRLILEHPDFYALHKPAGWLTHPVRAHGASRAPNVIERWQAETGESLGSVHRLDRETSGILLLSRDEEAARRFSLLFAHKMVFKSYLAIARGVPSWHKTSLSAPLAQIGGEVKMRRGVVAGGQEAITDFELLSSASESSLIRAKPKTGRTHQIRVHLQHLGLPLYGDKVYGFEPRAFLDFQANGPSEALTARLGLERQALHAETLRFPWDGAQVRIDDPMPVDMRALCGRLGLKN